MADVANGAGLTWGGCFVGCSLAVSMVPQSEVRGVDRPLVGAWICCLGSSTDHREVDLNCLCWVPDFMPPLDAGTPHSAVSGLLFRLSKTLCLPVRGLGWSENVYDIV